MSVDRDLCIRILTNLDYFSDIIKMLIDEGLTFNDNGIIYSLSEDDIDDYDYIEFDSFNAVKTVLDKREMKGYSNYIIMWDKDIDDSYLVRSYKLKDAQYGFKNYYEIKFGIGYGKRIKGADRYTDFGVYLNRLIPMFIRNSIYVCEVHCSDLDC